MVFSAHSTPPQSVEFVIAPTVSDAKQKTLAKFCFWEAYDQVLWVDARKIFPEIGVLKLPAWDLMLMDHELIPDYPEFLKPLDWPRIAQTNDWLRQIPSWVADSCRLFPSHQLTLLHYVGKYPQLLELLDHAPYLAWRLVTSKLQEPEMVALLSGKRQQIVEQLGWPGLDETLKFLKNLRLRQVTPMIIEQVETCALDPKRLSALQHLPRINSMALTLASRFPELIGCPLHLSLAKQPCQPMQCQSMVALLEDVFRFISQLDLGDSAVEKVKQCLYLSQVHHLYLQWMLQAMPNAPLAKTLAESLNSESSDFQLQWSAQVQRVLQKQIDAWQLSTQPKPLVGVQNWQILSLLQEHAWWLEASEEKVLYVWLEDSKSSSSSGKQINDEGLSLWGALVNIHSISPDVPVNIYRVRGMQSRLPQSRQLSDLHIFLAGSLPKKV
ncbi:hypothetical protein [Thiomicrorhabdus indica]|uniref:hypothetical protein n=1 Tax=Thiomicrorhabdus indica TaxID=2267253 RepID=UPI001F0E9FFF|nr:hypothetical protein [Thiomicrorhabdus indica]